jgi:hypothetical protein
VTAARRAAAWQVAIDAVTAGCPVPESVHVDRNGAGVTVTVDHLHDLAAWRAYLRAPAATVEEYERGPADVWQRVHTIEQAIGTVLVDIKHFARVPAPFVAGAR